jgi:hypothetical protein
MDNVIICRVWMAGKTSMCMTVDPQIKEFMGLIPREIIAFRCRTVKGRKYIIGEKIPMSGLANPEQHIADLLPTEKK